MTSQKNIFTSFKEIKIQSKGKKIFLFGVGNIAEKTIRKLDESFSIVDNNSNLWNTSQCGVVVDKPDSLTKLQKIKPFIIICTTSFSHVVYQLENLGFRSGNDFAVSPILNDLRIISFLESCKKNLLFSSGAPEQRSPNYGGGIYEIQVDGDTWEYKKVYSGNCYGMIKKDDQTIISDHIKVIVSLDKNYNITKSSDFFHGTRVHGIAYSDITQNYYVAACELDKILILDKNFKIIASIPLSSKYEKEKSACHHCNDVCVVGHSLYVSMFSATGNWKRDIYDGVVIEIDIESHEILGVVISGLWMPHNISFFNGSLVVLDSLRGELKKNNAQVVGKFPGFTRGIDFDGVLFFIGQSRNRNFSKYIGLSRNISIDTSVIIFDEDTKVSRSLQLPSKISEIHSILLKE